MALVDANYRFIYIDVGSCGRNSDGGTFQKCSLNQGMQENSLNIPAPSELPKAVELGKLPYVKVADEAFPLEASIMCPYPGKKMSYEQSIFNYRLCRVRRIVENAFGILSARWRVFHTKINLPPSFVISIVKAACCLHNFLCNDVAFLEDSNENNSVPLLRNLRKRGYRSKREAIDVRKKFATYFNDHDVLEHQHAVVSRGKF